MAVVDHSPDAARGALMGLFGWSHGRELIEVSVKSPSGSWRAQHWDVATLTDAETIKMLAYWSEQGREIYMGCVGLTERPDKTWRRGGAKLRGHAGALWLDVDCEAPGREGTGYFATVNEAVEVVDACLGRALASAALVVGSGWGVQYWIPLAEPVPGPEASRLVRALVGWVGEMSAKQIDRVWDLTRVMRMPGTLNWRAGPDESEARPAGVIRWPEPACRGDQRLSIWNVIDALADVVSDVLEIPRLEPELDRHALVDALLGRYSHDGEATGDSEPGGWAHVDDVLGDLDRLADELLTWEDVLVPAGWRCTSGLDPGHKGHEEVWERPGKGGETEHHGERSAVVYADKPELLVVYSDSPATGFSAGLRGSGRRGSAAGVGVISKWRAWVDLRFAGDQAEARRCVRAGGGDDEADVVVERLAVAWKGEMDWVEEWGRERELEALADPFTTTMGGTTDP